MTFDEVLAYNKFIPNQFDVWCDIKLNKHSNEILDIYENPGAEVSADIQKKTL